MLDRLVSSKLFGLVHVQLKMYRLLHTQVELILMPCQPLNMPLLILPCMCKPYVR